jgi:hypothetical protein
MQTGRAKGQGQHLADTPTQTNNRAIIGTLSQVFQYSEEDEKSPMFNVTAGI